MDLALELGFQTVEAMRSHMTEREFGQWVSYASRRMLPMRRIELLLANIARITAGGEALAPFVFDKRLREMLEPKIVATLGDAATAIQTIAGGVGIYKLGERKIADILKEAA